LVAIREFLSTSPPLSPSPKQERGRDIKREASPLFDFLEGGGEIEEST